MGLIRKSSKTSTCMRFVEGCKCHHEEGSGVFASIDQMGKGSLGVTVSAQALNESQPSRNALNNRSHTIRIVVADLFICKQRSNKRQRRRKLPSNSLHIILVFPQEM